MQSTSWAEPEPLKFQPRVLNNKIGRSDPKQIQMHMKTTVVAVATQSQIIKKNSNKTAL